MSDARLRQLEHDALASGDSASWQAYYRERERLGLRQQSGARTMTLTAPTSCHLSHVQFLNRQIELDLLESIELEWKRCGSPNGALTVTDMPREKLGPTVYCTAPWRDALIYLPVHMFEPSPDNTTIPHDWVARPDSGPKARFCRGCRTLDVRGTWTVGCLTEAHGLDVSRLDLREAQVTFPEFLPDPMILVRFTDRVRQAAWRAPRMPAVHEQINRIRPLADAESKIHMRFLRSAGNGHTEARACYASSRSP